MKKAMVYVIALTLALSTMLTGCGETRRSDDSTVAPSETPQQTMTPETMMPDPEDGVVRDNDGIITEGDTGGTGTTTHTLPESSANPGIGNGNVNNGKIASNGNTTGKR